MERDPEAKDGDGAGPFRLEDETAPAAVPGEHAVVPPPDARAPAPEAKEERAVDVRTVRERLDPASVTVPGPLPPPPGWPGEALRYPWRGRGTVALLVAAAVFAGADLLTIANAFLGAIVKIVLLAWAIAWQTRALLSTALGADRPPRAWRPDDLEGGTLGVLARVGLRTGLYLVPALVAWVVPYVRDPKVGHDARSWTVVAAWTAGALLFAPVVLLGSATGNPRMTWPWGALPWLFRGLRVVLAAAGSWAALVAAEVVVARFDAPSGGAFLACLALRAVVLTLLLAAGRGLGVLGRRYAL